MNVYLIDYSGTLDRFDYPLDVPRWVKAEGHLVCLHTGTPIDRIEEDHPGLVCTFDHVEEKGSGLPFAWATQMIQRHPEISRIIVVDDEEVMGRLAVRMNRRTPGVVWEYIHADQFKRGFTAPLAG